MFLKLLDKLMDLLTAPRPADPEPVCRGWSMTLIHAYADQYGLDRIWLLRRPNRTIHAMIGQCSDRLHQYYDCHMSWSARRN